MATKYLIECECRKTIPVEASQAGTTVACSCGAINQVPPFRQLREMPQQAGSGPPPARRARWGLREGIATLGGLVTVALAAWGLWIGSYIPPEDAFEQVVQHAMQREVDFALDQATPAQLYRVWWLQYEYLDEVGFSQPQVADNEKAWQEYTERLTLHRNVLLGGAAGVAVLTLLLWGLLPRTPQVASV